LLREGERSLSSIRDYGLVVEGNISESLSEPAGSKQFHRNAQFPRFTDSNRGTSGSSGSDDSHLRMEELKTHAWADNTLTRSDGSNMGGGITGGCNNGNNANSGNNGDERTSSRQENSFGIAYNLQERSENIEVEYNSNARREIFEVEYMPDGMVPYGQQWLFPGPSVPVLRLEPEGSSNPVAPVCPNNNSQERESACEVTEETEVKQPHTAERHGS